MKTTLQGTLYAGPIEECLDDHCWVRLTLQVCVGGEAPHQAVRQQVGGKLLHLSLTVPCGSGAPGPTPLHV